MSQRTFASTWYRVDCVGRKAGYLAENGAKANPRNSKFYNESPPASQNVHKASLHIANDMNLTLITIRVKNVMQYLLWGNDYACP